MNWRYYLRKVRDVPFEDIASIFPMVGALLAKSFVGKKYRYIWAVSERKEEARDNGLHFYRYMTTCHPEQSCVYVIQGKAIDREKVAACGTVVKWGSIQHWLLYFCAEYLISSQRFSPSGYLTTALERAGLIHPNHVFLQHGITINHPEYLEANRRPVVGLTTATPEETAFVKKAFGYSEDAVWMTGFARFDALHDFQVEPGRVLIMPTWRKWLRLRSEATEDKNTEQELQEYVDAWLGVFRSEIFRRTVTRYALRIAFVLHSNMKKVISEDTFRQEGVEVIDLMSCDLQDQMKKAQAMITDYSSVFFDMVYMKKPVIFYQFDEKKFREHHYKKGWFDYHTSPFGTWCETPVQVGHALEQIAAQDFLPSSQFLMQHSKTFECYDKQNCERIYQRLHER